MTEHSTIFRRDYRPFTHSIDSVSLDFVLNPESTQVTSTLLVTPRRGAATTDLVLNGEGIKFVRLMIDGRQAEDSRFTLTDHGITVKNIAHQSRLTFINTFNPSENTDLSGIYMSRGAFMSQCEAEGFRHITYWPDRPDVMSRFTVTIHADATQYPVLLSNGNLSAKGAEEDGRHWVRWEDPFKKPCYLFALVAGKFRDRSETVTLKDKREVLLQVWTEEQNYDKSAHALESLKNAITWDEERFGLSLDLDRFMIVATDDFNFGAMENKGLNIFNSRYVMASPAIATDDDYDAIESVVGHEYFHNWTGDRVTLRDWFQLTLKEGLTVFRDQEFSMDMAGSESARAVKRISDVRALRARQFPEDAGPMAHPIRPDSYMEINNFYTMTVYEKGAEVIRMLQTILGREGFRKGIDLYISRHDGSAVTCDDFIRAMADANDTDLTHFALWWSQSGTPRVTIDTSYDQNARTYTVHATQSTPVTPDQKDKHPLVIPITLGLLDKDGRDMVLMTPDETEGVAGSRTVLLSTESDTWVFKDIDSNPVPSIGRGFSAPVVFEYGYSRDELCFLARHDSDPFNRSEAFQRLALDVLNEMVDEVESGKEPEVHENLYTAFDAILSNDELSPLFKSVALKLPTESAIAQSRSMINPDSVRHARQRAIESVGRRFSIDLANTVAACATPGAYNPKAPDSGKRALKNVALAYWLSGGNAKALLTARDQFDTAQNLTDKLSGLSMIVNSQSPAKVDVLNAAGQQWINEPLLLNKWFTVQATAIRYHGECPVVERVRRLMEFNYFSITNPNNVYALVNAFCANNEAEFHALDGSGYALWKEMVLKLDPVNTHVAGRLARALDNWRRYTPDRARMMYDALKEVAAVPTLSRAVREIVQKSLGTN